MFEQKTHQLLPRREFLLRLLRNFGFGMLLIVLSLAIGMAGYHWFENKPWIDAFANAAMILSGMGPLGELTTPAGKIFAGLYALYSGLAIITITAIVFAPVIHRFLHKFHLEGDEQSSN